MLWLSVLSNDGYGLRSLLTTRFGCPAGGRSPYKFETCVPDMAGHGPTRPAMAGHGPGWVRHGFVSAWVSVWVSVLASAFCFGFSSGLVSMLVSVCGFGFGFGASLGFAFEFGVG